MPENESPLDGLLTKQGLAKKLQCSVRTIDNLTADGKVPKIKLGRLIRYRYDQVLESLTK